MMAKTYTVFKIVPRSTILDFTLHLIAAVYADAVAVNGVKKRGARV